MLALAGPASAKSDPGPHPATKATPAHVVKPKPRPPVGKPPTVTHKSTSNGTVRPAAAWSVGISASSYQVLVTQYITVTGTADQAVDGTGYAIFIWDLNAQGPVATCYSGTTCSASVTYNSATEGGYVAEIAPSGSGGQNSVAESGGVYPIWQAVYIDSLTTSSTTMAVGGSATLTATLSADIQPTYLWLDIFDATTGTYIGDCAGGTTCTATVTQSAASTHRYVAYLTVGFTESYPPPNVEYTSSETPFVTWTPDAYQVSLTGPSSESYSGGATLTATANVDVGPTPYYIEVFNENTGALVGYCGSGTTCTVTDNSIPSGSSGLVPYVAFVSSYGTTLPPSGVEASSNVVPVVVRSIP
jgi:hypothetical protein